MVNNTVTTVQIWDTAGQEKYQSIGHAFYRGADCCAITFDITNRSSFDNLRKWKDGFIEHAGPSDPEKFPFVVMGNKADKPDRSVSKEEAEAWCRANGDLPYFETSAIRGDSVEDAFLTMVKKALANQE